MSGACRENFSIWRNPRMLLRRRTWRYSKRLVFDDSVLWMVCAVIGHRPYNTSTIYESPEHACRRCHRWLRFLDPPIPVPSEPYINARIPKGEPR